MTILLAIVVCYTVLLVFASFNLIPLISRYIRIPYEILLQVLAKVVNFLVR